MATTKRSSPSQGDSQLLQTESPWMMLQGLKVEWATVKDSHLYVGSTGKEWTTTKGV